MEAENPKTEFEEFGPNPPKILHVSQMLPGGTSSYLREVLPYQMQRLGTDALIVAIPQTEIDYLPFLPRTIVRPFPNSKRSVKGLLNFFISVMTTILRDRPTIVHLHSSFAGLLRFPIALLPRGKRPAVIYCAHGWAFNMSCSSVRKRAYAWIERLLTPLTDRTIAISRFEGRTAEANGLDCKHLRVIENGIESAPPSVSTAGGSFDPAMINLLFIGRLDEQKGFDLLVRAMERVQDYPIHLHVVGASILSEGDDAAIRSANITAYGWVPRDRVPEFIAQCDAVIMPSRWEGFGLAAIEAMRQGKPVVASNVGALPEVIGDAGILFDTGNVEALCEVLTNIDKARLQRLGICARERFLKCFTSERMNREILACYAEVV